MDPLRITVGVASLGLTGSEVSQRLEQEFGVVAELATQQVLFSPPQTTDFAVLEACLLDTLCGYCSS